ncbi:MAG: STAS domain-containing protein [Acidobacteria bacterium]|jgi:anti-anti-sigma factor|nr:STAS domain-containing protein [Acidobacteriota bacterium]
MSRSLSLNRRCLDDVLVLDVVGDLVVGPPADAVWSEMDRAWADGTQKVLLNLSGLQYIDSTGVGAVLAAGKSAPALNRQVKLCSIPPLVAKVFATLRVSSVLETYDDEPRALASFKHQPGA